MISVAIIHSQLKRHGSEKVLFEIAKNLKKEDVTVEVFVRPLFIKNQYYYKELKKIGIEIKKRFVTMRHLTYPLRKLYIKWIPKTFIEYAYKIIASNLYVKKLKKYDKIIVIGMETYCDSILLIDDKEMKRKVKVIHVMHAFQQERNYQTEYDLNEIIVIDEKQKKELISEDINLNISIMKLPFEMRKKNKNNINFVKNEILNIGVVSRLSLDRPNEIIFELYAQLKKINNNKKIKLHWFGGGDISIYKDLLKKLGIENEIIFHGHINGVDNLKEYDINIFWQTCMGKSLNYAPIELISLSYPTLLINIDKDLSFNSDKQVIVTNFTQLFDFHKDLNKKLEMLIDINYEFVKSNYIDNKTHSFKEYLFEN